MDQVLVATLDLQRFIMLLLGAFSGLAVLLAGVGVYGLISYVVSQRTHEVGVRIALGAGVGDVLALIIRRGMLLAAIGTALGLVGALGLTRLLSRPALRRPRDRPVHVRPGDAPPGRGRPGGVLHSRTPGHPGRTDDRAQDGMRVLSTEY